mgnify:CR=1 FL=1
MRPIGGYFELECGRIPLYYTDGIYLNICRNAIRYVIRALGIKRLHLPIYTCHVVADAVAREGCEILRYHLDKKMMPAIDFPTDDFIIYNNYFGVLGKNVEVLSKIYPNLIVDNAQAFYSRPKCRAAVYSPRKFFGLPDGGILRGKDIPVLKLDRGHSIDVTSHLLKRLDYGVQSGYPDFVANDNRLDDYPLQSMSNLTLALMGNINYYVAKQRRLENFRYLSKHLSTEFPIAITSDDVPLVYPYLTDKGSMLRDSLIHNNIFCAKYWPNVLDEASNNSLEYHFANDIVAIPIDQRYGTCEMIEIINIIKNYNE